MLDHSRLSFLTHSDHIDRAALLQRICVRPPYFALNNLHYSRGQFTATAVAEHPATSEVGPMQACEISRHAAICGLSAVAMNFGDDDRRYYLAQDATYQGYANSAPYGSDVSFEARITDQNKRQATAEIIVTAGGQDLALLSVTYTILNEASFKRLFRSKHSPFFTNFRQTEMPYLPSGEFVQTGRTCTVSVPRVPEEACAGHFEFYPALPVAMLMGQLGTIAGRMYARPYRVEAATMTASDFCWAGESAQFEVTALAENGSYACAALASGTVVSDMRLRLAAGVSDPLGQAADLDLQVATA
ncbi:hypothetical protein [Deinococcus sonorensis]|uniref:Dehydrogenase (DH) domain-containing protein n=2 Tax=Deinococcus sonorensis TaxID=309891 RepID=A0AAU7U4Z5_9DEIO